jgi:hypothetical protein
MVLASEVERAIKTLSRGKAAGEDNIPSEMVRAALQESLAMITKLCQRIWQSSSWPTEWRRSLFIPIPKKGNPKECANYRTIALIPHVSKILLKVIQRRMEPYMEQELAIEQAGFRRNRGTRDHISNLRWIMEKAREYNRTLYICYIDYTKAFDCVDHDKLWTALRGMGVPEHLIVLIRSLYLGRQAMAGLLRIMKDRGVSKTTKIRLVQTLVFPTVLYGSESWTMRKADRKKIDAFELWCWRRMLRIPWTAKRTNASVLNEVKPRLSLEARMLQQRLVFFGHVMRADDSMEKSIMLGKIEGSRRRGRPRARWLDTICEATGKRLAELRSMTRQRIHWKAFVHEVARSRRRLDGT